MTEEELLLHESQASLAIRDIIHAAQAARVVAMSPLQLILGSSSRRGIRCAKIDEEIQNSYG
ncbi:hypothetical protein N7539_000139 [Penicillium diatomitis]|uniref:Uncharacterized protein n=1 Tax=Penicillium diatomitis TaxID=2819901 RepID=A0A9X0C1W5_9EURO|nr:uncharacterized protein N7539_000139 [Penicillium diatomitis]KAJ5495023.1 hypothetical protein N7539_000139 [Penicillium diatomitis]